MINLRFIFKQKHYLESLTYGEQYRNIIDVFLPNHKKRSTDKVIKELVDTIQHEALHYCFKWCGCCKNSEEEVKYIQKILKNKR